MLISTTKVLVIDEVSMLEAEFFDKIEYVARKVRDNEEPFGGLQVAIQGFDRPLALY